MTHFQQTKPDQSEDSKLDVAKTGNASNPTPHDKNQSHSGDNKLLNKKAEKYIRESGNIEDLPDAQEQ